MDMIYFVLSSKRIKTNFILQPPNLEMGDYFSFLIMTFVTQGTAKKNQILHKRIKNFLFSSAISHIFFHAAVICYSSVISTHGYTCILTGMSCVRIMSIKSLCAKIFRSNSFEFLWFCSHRCVPKPNDSNRQRCYDHQAHQYRKYFQDFFFFLYSQWHFPESSYQNAQTMLLYFLTDYERCFWKYNSTMKNWIQKKKLYSYWICLVI